MLLAPTAKAMRIMLQICDDFATKYSLKLNASKSKSLTICLYNKRTIAALNLNTCSIGGNVIGFWAAIPRGQGCYPHYIHTGYPNGLNPNVTVGRNSVGIAAPGDSGP